MYTKIPPSGDVCQLKTRQKRQVGGILKRQIMSAPMQQTVLLLIATVWLLGSAASALTLAPYDSSPECNNATAADSRSNRSSSRSANEVVLVDSHSYLSLDRLWYADDESIDLFTFPVPTDPVAWELVDQTPCRNVWLYCGDSTSDILITQLVSRGEVVGIELFVQIEFNFFSETLPNVPLSCAAEDSVSTDSDSENVLIVEADDTISVISERIPCGAGRLVNDSERVRHYYEFTYTPEDSFELVVRANLSDGSCVNVSRIRAFHYYCPNVTLNYVQYQQTIGGMYSGACVPNALPVDGPNVTAQCTIEGEWNFPPNLTTSDHCLCVPGYYSDEVGLECIPCPNGTYKSNIGGGECLPCPMNSHTTARGSSLCQCNSAYIRTNRLDITTDCEACAKNYFPLDGVCTLCPMPGSVNNAGALSELCMCLNGSASLNNTGENNNSILNSTCDFCAPNYYRSLNNDSCLLCPLNSFREASLHAENSCYCLPNHLTTNGLSHTLTDPCDKCNASYYISGTRCLPCPAYSSSIGLGNTECICEVNTTTPNGNATTTNKDCVCLAGLFRTTGGDCVPCPENSNRSVTIQDKYCSCDTGHARRSGSPMTEPCYGPVIGFNQRSLQVLEGTSTNQFPVTIYSSFPVPESIIIDVEITNGSTFQDSLLFPRGETRIEYFAVVQGDRVALETDQVIQIKLIQSGSGYIIEPGTPLIGGQLYHSVVNVTVREDDIVYVGFTQTNIITSVSQSYLELVVGISTDIGRDLAILVMQNVSLSVFTIERTTLTFVPNGSLHLTVPIQLSSETTFLVDAFYVGLSVELVDKEYLRDEIRVGGGSGLNDHMTMVLLPPRDTQAGLSAGAELGIISSAAAFLIAFLALVGVLLYCYCRRKIYKPKSTRNHYEDEWFDSEEERGEGMMELKSRDSKLT